MTGLELVSAREARGLSRPELARAAGVDYYTLRRWEIGKGVPHQSTIRRVLQTLHKLPVLPTFTKEGKS